MSQRTWLLVKGTPAWVYKQALILNCNNLISSISYYSFIVYIPIWITLLYSRYFGLFLCEQTLFVSFGIRASSDPALGRTLLKLCLSRLLANPFISELIRFQGPWPKIGFWPFKYSEFLWLSWSLTIIGLLAKHKIFRVSLNLVFDHNQALGHSNFQSS